MNIERIVISLIVVVTLAIPWVQAVASAIRNAADISDTTIAFRLSLATILVLVIPGLRRSWFIKPRFFASMVLAASGIAVVVLSVLAGEFRYDLFSLIIVCPLAAWAAAILAHRLPNSMDGLLRRRPTLSILWCIVAVLATTQTARLGTYMSDPNSSWWLTVEDPFWSGHMCLTAYLYGAELNREGATNVYDPAYYPGLTPTAVSESKIENFEPDDPFQYPPQFLVLPRIALALSNDFLTIRTFWYAIQTTTFMILGIGLCCWIGGNRGIAAGLMLPFCWLSLPLLIDFQYGQFHLMAIMFAVSAMLFFESRRNMIGGSLLAIAILSKMFPAILLIPLVAKGRWRCIGWTFAFIGLFSLVSLPIIGTEPFTSFVEYHLPRVSSGEAFSFIQAWPEYKDDLIAANQSPIFWNLKLEAMGMTDLPDWISKFFHLSYGVFVICMAYLAGVRHGDKHYQAWQWLAILGLASIFSPGAFADYITVSAVWLLTLLPFRQENRRWQLLLLTSWLAMFFLPGIYPLPPLIPEPVIPLSIVGLLFMIGLFVWVILKGDLPDKKLRDDARFR